MIQLGPDPNCTILGQILTFSDCATLCAGILLRHEFIEEFNAAQLFIMPMMFVLALLMAIDSIKICKE